MVYWDEWMPSRKYREKQERKKRKKKKQRHEQLAVRGMHGEVKEICLLFAVRWVGWETERMNGQLCGWLLWYTLGLSTAITFPVLESTHIYIIHIY